MSASADCRTLSRRAVLAAVTAGVGAGLATQASAQSVVPSVQKALPAAWSQAERLPLWSAAPPGAAGFKPGAGADRLPRGLLLNIERPELRAFRPQTPNGKALLIIPGGGYATVSVLNEGLEIAARMTTAGYTAFVLVYRLPREGWTDRADAPLQDAQRAMRLIRRRADRYGVRPEDVAAVGFSAGGHLAASLATGFAERVYAPHDDLDALDARPAAVGLIYPVIMMDGPYAHQGSARSLLGEAPRADLVARRSPAQHITPATPLTFLAHAADDPVVPMQNSIVMLEALHAARRPVEAHIFPKGGHGFGLGPHGSACAEWSDLFLAWLGRSLAS